MRHWTVSLVRDGSVSRQWHVWAETLTIGSHGAAKVRLPLPVEPWALRLSELPEPQTFQLAEFTVQVADTTSERSRLWESAQVRIERARIRAEREGEASVPTGPSTFKTAVTGLCLAGFTHWLADILADRHDDRDVPRTTSAVLLQLPSQAVPESPFQTIDREVIAAKSGYLLSGIGSAKDPSGKRSIQLSTPSQGPERASRGSWGGVSPWAPESESPRAALAAASWPQHGPESWESLDQPPPEPPH